MRGIASLKGTVHPASLQNSQRNHCLITRAASRLSFESSRITRLLDLSSALPLNIQELARKKFKLLKQNPGHPSLHFKKVRNFWRFLEKRSRHFIAQSLVNFIFSIDQ
jgi:hypothetical protein